MRLLKLELLVNTLAEDFGVSLAFKKGLNVFWADNSMGKSTCVNSIIYALGLEAMLSTKKAPPIKRALLDVIEYKNGKSVSVTESTVSLVIENQFDEFITIKRTIKGEKDTKLISVFFSDGVVTDFYVGVEGGATRERGFHHFLADFLGLELPTVTTFEGREVPLYLEALFPFMLVNQTRGWSTVSPPLPTQFGIREIHRRAVEFLLNLVSCQSTSVG